jgi:hypothetical protein
MNTEPLQGRQLAMVTLVRHQLAAKDRGTIVVDLLSARWHIGNRQGAILLFTVGDLDLLEMKRIFRTLFYVALRARDGHERCLQSRGLGGGRDLRERGHDEGQIGVEWVLLL